MDLKLEEKARALLTEKGTLISRINQIDGSLKTLDELAKTLGEEHEEQHEKIETENLTNED